MYIGCTQEQQALHDEVKRYVRRICGVSVACLEDFDPFSPGEVAVVDGVDHPSDR